MYRMKEFSAMTGLPQSKIRFYEKHGLILSDRQENGYRVFTPKMPSNQTHFVCCCNTGSASMKRSLCSTRNKAQEEFEWSLLHQQKEKLMHEADLIAYRLRRLESTPWRDTV